MDWLIVAIIIVVAVGAPYLVYRRRKALHSSDAPSSPTTQPPEPRAEPRMVKPAISELSSLPEEHKKRLLDSSWYMCENPDCKRSSFLNIHQIVPDIEGGTYALDNLIILCSVCHSSVHNGEIAPKELKSWIRKREDRFKYDLDWPYK